MTGTTTIEPTAGSEATGAERVPGAVRHRDSLLAATASASRLLLEAPHVLNAVPDVLRLLGEAAGADRVTLSRAITDPDGTRYFLLEYEWVASGVVPLLGTPGKERSPESRFPMACAELRAGRTVCMIPTAAAARSSFEGEGTLSKAIVPILVDGEYFGCVSFDNTRQRRAIDQAELSALETAAGVIGSALHRERLTEIVRHEREQAAELRMAELARANAVIRGNLQRLAGEPDVGTFLGTMLLEATRQFGAASGLVIVRKDVPPSWEIVTFVRDGQLAAPPVPATLPTEGHPLADDFQDIDAPCFCDLSLGEACEAWPGMAEFHRREGHQGLLISPLLFGARNVGLILLCFRERHSEEVARSELLVAMAHQATLAIEIMRLAQSAKDAAVLVERNRIGREIHDGLAQAFTGILMQLEAADELRPTDLGSTQSLIRDRIRDLAREGLGEARRSVSALRPDQAARRGGLELALRQLAERSSVYGRVSCVFEGGAVTTGLAPEHEHALLRIAQEAVSNAVRHGRPSTVRISLTEDNGDWLLSVRDDGVGMSATPEECAQHGFGLTSIRERVTAIGGDWSVASQSGAGTHVTVRLPRRKAA